jgi:hypothetical protein
VVTLSKNGGFDRFSTFSRGFTLSKNCDFLSDLPKCANDLFSKPSLAPKKVIYETEIGWCQLCTLQSIQGRYIFHNYQSKNITHVSENLVEFDKMILQSVEKSAILFS